MHIAKDLNTSAGHSRLQLIASKGLMFIVIAAPAKIAVVWIFSLWKMQVAFPQRFPQINFPSN
jgi:hypothetical protein